MKRVAWGMAVALAGMAAPASAVVTPPVTPFASFSPIGTTGNVKFVNSSNEFGTAKNNGAFGAVKVRFSFLTELLNDLDPIAADFTFIAKSTDTVHTVGTQRVERQYTGSFSFIATQAFTTSFGASYGIGTNLLSGTFSLGQTDGKLNGTTIGFSGSTAAGAGITFTSSVLDFSSVTAKDFSLSTVALTPKLTVNANGKYDSFKGTANGQFSSAVTVRNVPNESVGEAPEPASWAMMLAGFGLIGAATRRRRRVFA